MCKIKDFKTEDMLNSFSKMLTESTFHLRLKINKLFYSPVIYNEWYENIIP